MCIKPIALEINIIVFLKFVWTLKVTVISMFVWPFARPCFQNAFHSVTQAHMMKKIPMHNERNFQSLPKIKLTIFCLLSESYIYSGAHLLQKLIQFTALQFFKCNKEYLLNIFLVFFHSTVRESSAKTSFRYPLCILRGLLLRRVIVFTLNWFHLPHT